MHTLSCFMSVFLHLLKNSSVSPLCRFFSCSWPSQVRLWPPSRIFSWMTTHGDLSHYLLSDYKGELRHAVVQDRIVFHEVVSSLSEVLELPSLLSVFSISFFGSNKHHSRARLPNVSQIFTGDILRLCTGYVPWKTSDTSGR